MRAVRGASGERRRLRQEEQRVPHLRQILRAALDTEDPPANAFRRAAPYGMLRNYVLYCTVQSHTRIECARLTALQSISSLMPLQCSICKKTFSQAANLSAHLRIHSGTRSSDAAHCPPHCSALYSSVCIRVLYTVSESLSACRLTAHSRHNPITCAANNKALCVCVCRRKAVQMSRVRAKVLAVVERHDAYANAFGCAALLSTRSMNSEH